MISQMALDDIKLLQKEGLEPTPEDIVRLNVLALEFERVKSKQAFTSVWYLPRVAAVSDTLWFRQPTIGHDIWLEKVWQWANDTDSDTVLAIYAYALSRNYDQLPEPYDKERVSKDVNDFIDIMLQYTKEQIRQALSYVQNGISQNVGVYAAPSKNNDDKNENDDWGLCISLGVMNNAKPVLWGITETEMKNMPREQLEDLVDKAYKFHGMNIDNTGSYELGRYNRTLDVIHERLQAEKDKKVTNG